MTMLHTKSEHAGQWLGAGRLKASSMLLNTAFCLYEKLRVETKRRIVRAVNYAPQPRRKGYSAVLLSSRFESIIFFSACERRSLDSSVSCPRSSCFG
jgi:hypothetical protein